jgi:hypothetical protein
MLEISCWISQALNKRPLDRLEMSETYYPETRGHVPEQRRRQMKHFQKWVRVTSKVLDSVNLSMELSFSRNYLTEVKYFIREKINF